MIGVQNGNFNFHDLQFQTQWIFFYQIEVSSLDKGQVFSFKPSQSSLFLGMSEGQESKFLAVFDLLYSSSGPQKP